MNAMAISTFATPAIRAVKRNSTLASSLSSLPSNHNHCFQTSSQSRYRQQPQPQPQQQITAKSFEGNQPSTTAKERERSSSPPDEAKSAPAFSHANTSSLQESKSDRHGT
mmetsp:Transcript_16091/g.32902  ORF Transcript_16091/g.32902 Transcript_16091/m.32902 type:complete len:110 (-) Transcript_16091:918-1247(-)